MSEMPHDLQAEEALIGAMASGETPLFSVIDVIRAEMFYREEHRIIVEQIIEMAHEDQAVDLVTISARLREKNLSERVGGVNSISRLFDSLIDVANARHYAEIVRSLYLKRSLIEYARSIANLARGDSDAKEVLDEAMTQLVNVAEDGTSDDAEQIAASAERVTDIARQLSEGDLDHVGVRTGLQTLDAKVLLRHGRVCVLAGATSSGKSSLALQVADMIGDTDKTVLFCSLEMTADELAARILAARTETDMKLIEQGPVTPRLVERLSTAVAELQKSGLYIDDSVGVTPLDIRAKARRLQMKHGLDLVIVDYLQLMSSYSKNRSREQEVSEMSRALKIAARSLGVPIIVLSQLSRKHLEDKRKPELRDLRESGSIENDADVVLMVYRPDLRQTASELLIRKQRQGPLGRIEMDFDHATTRFVECGFWGIDSDAQVPYTGCDMNETDENNSERMVHEEASVIEGHEQDIDF
jgi:replicative DNA helicase